MLNDVALNKSKVLPVLKDVGLLRFAGAVMSLLQEVLGLREENMLVPPDERTGRFLLDDIMRAGNFGANERKSDKRTGRLAYKQSRLWRYAFSYPSEVLWAPTWKAWHWAWRRV